MNIATYHESGAPDEFDHSFSIDVEFDNGLTLEFFLELKFSECGLEDSEADVKLILCRDGGTDTIEDPAAWGLEDTVDMLRDDTGSVVLCELSISPDPWADAGVTQADFL